MPAMIRPIGPLSTVNAAARPPAPAIAVVSAPTPQITGPMAATMPPSTRTIDCAFSSSPLNHVATDATPSAKAVITGRSALPMMTPVDANALSAASNLNWAVSATALNPSSTSPVALPMSRRMSAYASPCVPTVPRTPRTASALPNSAVSCSTFPPVAFITSSSAAFSPFSLIVARKSSNDTPMAVAATSACCDGCRNPRKVAARSFVAIAESTPSLVYVAIFAPTS